MKYVNQKEYPYWLYITRQSCEEEEERNKGLTTTIYSSGCGLCTAVMIASRLLPNCDFGLEDAMRISYACGANQWKGTNYWNFAPAFAQECGLELEKTNDPERLRYCLRTGGAAALHVKGDRKDYVGVFSSGGHWIAAISEERDGRIAILDPSYADGKYDREGCKGLVEMKNGVIALCNMDVILKDTEPADPSFYLFWRKECT